MDRGGDKMKILFVCLGNICRSPLAEGVAQYILEKEGLKLVVDSAGTSHWHEVKHRVVTP